MHFREILTTKIVLALLVLSFFSSAEASAQFDKEVFSFRGRQALSDGKYSMAIENFNIIARLDTTDYWTFFFRGIAKYNLGDLRGALNDFNTSVRLNPIFTNGFHYRAITYSRIGNYEAALQDYQEAIMLRPGAEGIYYSRGVTYFLSRQFDKAIKDFNRYIRKQPKDPSVYLNRGACYLYVSDTVSSFNDYNMAIKLDRFEPEAYIRRGSLFASRHQVEAGLSDFDKAIELDSLNTLAHFNRGILRFEAKDYKGAMDDMNFVLKEDPGNALTLYNRGLIKAQLGDMSGALADLDRVVNINPDNVLVYFNRASVFIEMGRYQDALADYTKAIELYPEFAKAYMNRSYVNNLLGRKKSSKADYDTAQQKIKEYREKNNDGRLSFADTAKKYNTLLALDADFAKKDFNDEMLQYRDVDVKLRPLYRFVRTAETQSDMILAKHYENASVDRFIATSPVPIIITNDLSSLQTLEETPLPSDLEKARSAFLSAIEDCRKKRYNTALMGYDSAVGNAMPEGAVLTKASDRAEAAFYLMNRAVLRADMIDFMASMDNTVQVLSMDEKGTTRARVSDKVNKTYDYSEAISDMKKANELTPGVAYILFNLGNLYCLSSDHISAIASYTRAINAYPYFADAYFNRGLVQIFLKDKEKGCDDLSVAGELGVKDAYTVIKKHCENAVH